MLAREWEFYRRVSQLVDGFLFGFAFFLAHLIRSSWQIEVFGGSAEIQPFVEHYAWLLLFIAPGGPLMLKLYGYYDQPILASRRQTIWAISKACFALVLGLILILWLMRVGPRVGRSVVILFGPLSFGLILGKELVRQWWVRRSAQVSSRNVILLGTQEETQQFEDELHKRPAQTFKVVSRIDLNKEPMQRLVEEMHKHAANAVIIISEHTFMGKIEQAIALCEREGVEAWVVVDFFRTKIAQVRPDLLFGRPVLVFRSTPDTSWPLVLKRLIDIIGASILLVVFAVPMVVIAILIKLTSDGPVLYRQQRAGLNGRPFTLLKFRTMYKDADRLKPLLLEKNEIRGPAFKLTDDPRVTSVGRILRKYSLDELPQLINVLRGEMSLVGPRPLPLDEVARFENPGYRRRLSVKPGLTCLWQISGRSNITDFEEWVRLDLEYIDNWSLWLDLKILLRTIPVVLTGEGAK